MVARSVDHVLICTLTPSLASRLVSQEKSRVIDPLKTSEISKLLKNNKIYKGKYFLSFADSFSNQAKSGGARRDRTADLLRARQALSQLSYGPSDKQMVGLGRFELPTSPLSGVRSNQLSYRPKVRFCLNYQGPGLLLIIR